MEYYQLAKAETLKKVFEEITPIINHLENCMEDDFEIHYETDCKSVLKELKGFRRRLKDLETK
jgi:nitrate reductase assembly molybdenum cofactor insertion protein NarJ